MKKERDPKILKEKRDTGKCFIVISLILLVISLLFIILSFNNNKEFMPYSIEAIICYGSALGFVSLFVIGLFKILLNLK